MGGRSPAILYLNTDPGARIPQMTFAGMRRYASARGWTAEAFSSKEVGKDGIPALLADRAPVVGCVYECSDDNLPASPEIFGGLPDVVRFTDYASAGNLWTPGNRYRVWLPELIPGRRY